MVACFWYGAQTSAASGAIVALLLRSSAIAEFNRNSHLLGHTSLETITFIIVWALQLLIIQHGMETVRRFQDWAGPAVWVMMLILAIYLSVKAGGISFGSEIPRDVLIKKTADAGIPFEPGSFAALAAVAATWITYFAALYLNFCDFSRFAPNKRAVWSGNVWGLPINLILFSFVAGITTTAAYAVYHEALLHPDEISARFDNWFLALRGGAHLCGRDARHQRGGQFRLAGVRLLQRVPEQDRLQEGRLYRRADRAHPLSLRAVGRERGEFRRRHRLDDGPGLRRHHGGLLSHPQRRDRRSRPLSRGGIYRYTNGWNINAVIAAAIGAVFSSILPNFTNLLPSWWGVYGWFFGVAIGGAVYYALVKARGAPVPRAARAAE